jgi:predicted Zn-dependent peptidase
MSVIQRKIQPDISPVSINNMPDIEVFNLNNGVPVFFIEAGTEEIMRIEFIFKAGQVKESSPLQASTTNMMLVEGTRNYDAESLNRTLDFYGTFLNLIVDKDSAGITIFFLNKHIEKVLELCLEILFRPVFPENELTALLKKRKQWYLVNREKVHNLASDQFFESIFGSGHPYGKQICIDDFDAMSPALLQKFHTEYYCPEQMAVFISGKIHNDTKNLLNKYFGEVLPAGKNSDNMETPVKGDAIKKVFIEKKGAIQSAIRIGSSTINKRHPDYHGLQITDTILGGYFGSRLMKNIREKKGYTYGINSAITSFYLSGYKVIATEVGKRYTEKTLHEIYKEIRLLQTSLIEPGELDVVRNYMTGELVRMFDGPFAIAESFRSAWEFGFDNSYYFNLAEKIKTIEPDEIIQLARTYYNIEELYEIIAGA